MSCVIIRECEFKEFFAIYNYLSSEHGVGQDFAVRELRKTADTSNWEYYRSLENKGELHRGEEEFLKDIEFSIGPGNFSFKYKSNRIFGNVDVAVIQSRTIRKPTTETTISLYCYGNSSVLRTFIKDALIYESKKKKEQIQIYPRVSSPTINFWKSKRNEQSVILKKGILESITRDIDDFLSSKDRYESMGVPYHRGYLLSGPPGCGKTSLTHYIASRYDLVISIIDLGSPTITDFDVETVMTYAKKGQLIVFEDIDCIFKKKKNDKKEKKGKNNESSTLMIDVRTDDFNRNTTSKVVLSSILNSLDGLKSGDGYIVIMTTNRPEVLDPALIRPGRVDKRYDIGYPDKEQIEQLFDNFYCREDDKQNSLHKFNRKSFINEIEENIGKISMAAIQGHFLNYKNSPVEAIVHAKRKMFA